MIHDNPDEFRRYIMSIAEEKKLPRNEIEKDYYLTLLLEKITGNENLVFKGGTSLSKGFGIINRFSEDIDFCVPHHLTRSERRNVRDDILHAIEDIGLTVESPDSLQSGSKFNRYVAPYHSLFDGNLNPKIKIETNMVRQSLTNQIIQIQGIHESFPVKVQSIEETFIEKIFALCDYYLQGKPQRNSRHLYDLYKMETHIHTQQVSELFPRVRTLRQREPELCPSAADGISIGKLLDEIIHTQFYKRDYDRVTAYLIHEDVSYDETITWLSQLRDRINNAE